MAGGTRLKKVGDKFRMKFKKVTGAEFYGQFLDIPDTARVSNFLSARRYLRTAPETSVIPTDVIIAGKEKFIVGEHGTGYYLEPIYKHFKLFQVDLESTIKRKAEVKNPVTGLKEVVRVAVPGTLYLSTQPKSMTVDEINIPQDNLVAVCDKEVLKGDAINGMLVVKVDRVLGLYLIELKEA